MRSCDRCGKRINESFFADINKVRVGLLQEYDLCNECKHDLQEWIKNRVDSEVEEC